MNRVNLPPVRFESLDARLLLAVGDPVDPADRVPVLLKGTKGDDLVILVQSKTEANSFYVYGAANLREGRLVRNASRFEIQTGAGDDRIKIIASDSTSISADIDPGAGNDVVDSAVQVFTSLEYATARTGIRVRLDKGFALDGQGGRDVLRTS